MTTRTQGTNRHSRPSAQRSSNQGSLHNFEIRANTYRERKKAKGTKGKEAEKTQKLSSNLEYLYQIKEQKNPGSFQKFFNDTINIKSKEGLSHQVKKEIVKELTKLTKLDAADIAKIGSNSSGRKVGEENLTGYIEALKKKLEKEQPNLAKDIDNTKAPDLLGKDKTESKPAEEQKDPDSVMDFPDAATPQNADNSALANVENETEALKNQNKLAEAKERYSEELSKQQKLHHKSMVGEIDALIEQGQEYAQQMNKIANFAKDAFETIKANRERSKQQQDSDFQRRQADAQKSQEEARRAATTTTAT